MILGEDALAGNLGTFFFAIIGERSPVGKASCGSGHIIGGSGFAGNYGGAACLIPDEGRLTGYMMIWHTLGVDQELDDLFDCVLVGIQIFFDDVRCNQVADCLHIDPP
jgi:hypothetical protein